jgi:very-short-patch-repair endonuclease
MQFRRQQFVKPYIFDFYCRAAALAIEVDGFAHECGDSPERDARRDGWAASRGIQTLRIRAIEIRDNLEGVLAAIVEACEQRTPPPRAARSPSPRNRGEDNGAP